MFFLVTVERSRYLPTFPYVLQPTCNSRCGHDHRTNGSFQLSQLLEVVVTCAFARNDKVVQNIGWRVSQASPPHDVPFNTFRGRRSVHGFVTVHFGNPTVPCTPAALTVSVVAGHQFLCVEPHFLQCGEVVAVFLQTVTQHRTQFVRETLQKFVLVPCGKDRFRADL